MSKRKRRRSSRDYGPESIGSHGYEPAKPRTRAEELRRLAERRRRYYQTTQSQGEQGSAYDVRRRRRRKKRRW